MEGTTDVEDRPSYLRAHLTVLAVTILHISTGAVMGWSSPILPKLNLTTEEQSLVGSLYSLGAAPGPFVVTFGLDTIGRKGTLYVLWASFLSSWIIMIFSQNLYVIYIARIIGGLGVGGACAGLPVYIAEIAIPDIRGRLAAMGGISLALGGLIVFGVGPYVSYRILNLFGGAIAAVFALFFYIVPESPYYYYKKGRKKDAEEALQRLRCYRTREKLEEELAEIEKAILLEKENSVSFLEGMRQPIALKAIGLSVFIVAMQQFQGVVLLNAYSQMIFDSAKLNFPATSVPVIYVICGMFFSALPVLLVNKLIGVKTAFIISGFGTSISLVLLGLYFYMINSGGVDLYDYSYISVVFLIMISLFSSLGIATLAWPIVAEILPLSVKGIGAGLAGCNSSILGFIFLAAFPSVAENYGYSTDFFGIALILFVSTAILTFIMPDTTGKTLQEIQQLLAK
ncbi:uncharacterized protein [Halyomorpha halys]|uniref:uncharacterized protein n=1 Tax=Halyomorpha halys TaxID=286706 RepID=UPI0006D4D708|nr:sugar transporter ERD6-like 6 [Halyomorpha halys]